MRALVANEPRTYREVLVNALRWLRPQIEVSEVEPDELEPAVKQLHPHLVVCSRASAVARDDVLTWVTLYPGGENLAEIVTAGGRAMLVGIQFDEFLSIVDGTELLYRRAHGEELTA